MPELPVKRIAELLAPYVAAPSSQLLDQLSAYLDLLMKWNARTNLTAIRDPEQIVCRHFGESLFAARHLPGSGRLLDLGSGAGFPGLPIQLASPRLKVTLAESQHKKSAFLREVVRTLELPTEVWPQRAEDLPEGRLFDVVTVRAVDNPRAAARLAILRLAPGGIFAEMTTLPLGKTEPGTAEIAIPGSERGILRLSHPSGDL